MSKILSEKPKAREENIVLTGVKEILGFPEFQSATKAKEIMGLLENRELAEILLSDKEGEITIRIGGETGVKEMEDCSIISVTIPYSKDKMARIGVIGPKRMDYAKVVSILAQLRETFDDYMD